MKAVDAWPGLERAADCGPFFDVRRWVGSGPGIDDAGWYPMTEFAEHPLGLQSRVTAARQSLSVRGFGGAGASPAVAARVAASVAFQGLAARLLSPVVGSAVTAGVVPDLSWDRLYWSPAALGVLPLASGPAAARPLDPAGDGSATRLILDAAVAAVLRLADVVVDRFLVSPRIVAGNTASALVGAALAASRGGPVADAALRLVTVPARRRRTGRHRTLRSANGSTVRESGSVGGAAACCIGLTARACAATACCTIGPPLPAIAGAGAAAGSAPAQQQDAGRYRHQQD